MLGRGQGFEIAGLEGGGRSDLLRKARPRLKVGTGAAGIVNCRGW